MANQTAAAAAVLSLDGEWTFYPQAKKEDDPTTATVPGCWENDGQPGILLTGAYEKSVTVPTAWKTAEARLWWECDAVSYHSAATVNDQPIGTHTGPWDQFAWEILPALWREQRDPLTLRLTCEKPADNDANNKPRGRFPVRETTAGFLPYVWGTWGGPWQSMRLRVTGPARIHQVFAPGKADGTIRAETEIDAKTDAPITVQFTLYDADGQVRTHVEKTARGSGGNETIAATLRLPGARLWTPENPYRYQLVVTVIVGTAISDTQTRTVGFREVRVENDQILLNGRPVFFRAPLSWGWYEDTRAPNPAPDVFTRELRQMRELGYNGMKLCLWVPPRTYFEIADAMGMLLWMELPLWLPVATEFSLAQIPAEYQRIVRQIGDHPSIVLWTVGCEIGKGVDSTFLGDLYRDVKEITHSPLVRDNSGSAECYGGPLPEHADYWDFHFYCDLMFTRDMFDRFAPRWRTAQPWLFGEFNDQDAFRDLPGIVEQHKKTPWWAKNDAAFNPQGVRWEYGVTEQLSRMQTADLLNRRDELKNGSRKQALLSRKHTLELVRAYPFMSGYVVTGLADTPISTAGMLDDFGSVRFSRAEFSPFNQDTVLFNEPDRRRAWVAGGDRPSFLDRYGVWGGAAVRRLIGVSHYGAESGNAATLWRVTRPSGKVFAEGKLPDTDLTPGAANEIGFAEFDAPAVGAPEKLVLTVTLRQNNRVISENSWPLWVYPQPRPQAEPVSNARRRVGLYDPDNLLDGFADATGIVPVLLRGADGLPADNSPDVPVLVATRWRPELREFVARGGHALLVQNGASDALTGDNLPAAALPFWREAMKLFDPHPLWNRFPHENFTDFSFYGLAAAAAFDLDAVAQRLGPDATLRPLLRRVDARSFAVHGYLIEARIGAGVLLLTTLRPQGNLGDQPSGLTRHVAGAYLLRALLDVLTPG